MRFPADNWHLFVAWIFVILALTISSVQSDLKRIKRAPPPVVDDVKSADFVRQNNFRDPAFKPRDIIKNETAGLEQHMAPLQDKAQNFDTRANQNPPVAMREQPLANKPVDNVPQGGLAGGWRPKIPVLGEGIDSGVDRRQTQGKKKERLKIASSVECSDDVRRFCSEEINNFQILDCLQDNEKTNNKVSEECHHFLWQYKLKLTTDIHFDQASGQSCDAELNKIPDCNQLERGKGLIIPCLIEHFDEITSRQCSKFINKMASIVFSDYRLMESFMSDCKSDVLQFHCGRVDLTAEEDGAVHSQGYTVSCLNGHRKDLSKKCKKSLLHVAELQADDYHLDRPLYYACKGDRYSLCPEVAAGDGAIFKCLYRHLSDKRLTEACRTKLEQREQLVAEDVKVDSAFYDACGRDIKANRCGAPPAEDNSEEDLSRSTILLCLEKAQSDGKKVQAKCLQEMFELRSELMQDYKISPELVSACEKEIVEFCDGGLELDGATIECLMKEAQEKKNADVFGALCKAEIQTLLAVANPGEDIRLDPPLQRACGDVAKSLCSTFKPGNGDVITCLFDQMDNDDMTEECEEKLLEIQYFAVRDFRLDHHLYKKCHADAKNLCGSDGFDDPKSMSPAQGPLIFSCLHRHLNSDSPNDKKPTRPCAHEIKRVLRERSTKIKLMPEIEAACLSELGDMCSDEEEITQVGGELECLQDNLEQLRPACRAAVGNFTEEEMGDVELDRILMKACTPMIKRFCEDLLHSDAMPDEVLECLIEHKTHSDMDEKCAVGIEHHQIVSLKDFRFNHKFREACQSSVDKYCKNKKKNKYEVVACLSELVRNDILTESEQRINKRCQKQLRFELLQRGESVKLDPDLAQACKMDINKFCTSERDEGGEIIECLHRHKKRLSSKCHKTVFQREKDDAIFGDYTVLHVCKKMIKKHCDLNSDEPTLLDCLNEHKDDMDFDEQCRKIVQRREVEKAQDIRLNPHLQKACRLDIPKYCADIYDQRQPDGELEGKVIDCLKMQYVDKKKPLSRDCEHEIQSRIKEANLDINKNPVVMNYCKEEIRIHCISEIRDVRRMSINVEEINDDDTLEYITGGQGRIVECLKKSFIKLKDMRCKKEIGYMIAESRVDVQVDPLLQAACQKDILTLCKSVLQGQGRQMSCLLSLLEATPNEMTPTCREMMQRRKDLWEYAAEVAPMESFSEMIDQIKISPARNYFFAVIFTVVGLIFIFGLTCGRVTKRLRAELKNK